MQDIPLPANPVAEAVLCNALLFTVDSRRVAFTRLDSDDFTVPAAREMFARLQAAAAAGVSFENPALVQGEIAAEGVADMLANASHRRWYQAVEDVLCASLKRRVAIAAAEAYRVACDPTSGHRDAREAADRLARSAVDGRVVSEAPRMPAVLTSLYTQIQDATQGRVPVMPWGVPGLDGVMLRPGVMAVVAARPRVGKTALLCTAVCAHMQSEVQSPIGLICFEMTSEEITARLLSLMTGYSVRALMTAQLPPAGYEALKAISERIKQWPLRLDCGRGMTVAEIRARAEEWRQQDGIRLLMVDYLQRVKPSRGKDMREQITHISRELKTLATEMKLPVIVSAQLNREAENQMPRLENLKEAGAIEEDADAVVLLDRPDANAPANERGYTKPGRDTSIEVVKNADMVGKIAMRIAKNRNGGESLHFADFAAETMAILPFSGWKESP